MVPRWDQLQSFVDAAGDGDSLCLCGRLYKGNTCGTTSITLEDAKQIKIECAPAQICSYDCPQSAFIVSDGTLTLQGTAQNFVFTGGIEFSRIVVGEDGGLVADQTIFEE